MVILPNQVMKTFVVVLEKSFVIADPVSKLIVV